MLEFVSPNLSLYPIYRLLKYIYMSVEVVWPFKLLKVVYLVCVHVFSAVSARCANILKLIVCLILPTSQSNVGVLRVNQMQLCSLLFCFVDISIFVSILCSFFIFLFYVFCCKRQLQKLRNFAHFLRILLDVPGSEMFAFLLLVLVQPPGIQLFVVSQLSAPKGTYFFSISSFMYERTGGKNGNDEIIEMREKLK